MCPVKAVPLAAVRFTGEAIENWVQAAALQAIEIDPDVVPAKVSLPFPLPPTAPTVNVPVPLSTKSPEAPTVVLPPAAA
jgi:hypothetical protein